ncbi:hypothetical protein GCM10023158_08440 [Gluconacetobacter tumulicola]
MEQMAADARSFIQGLDLPTVDLLGFSLGSMLAQVLAAQHPDLIRKIIIAGAAPRGGEEHLVEVVGEAFAVAGPDVRLPLFFTPTEESQRAGRAFVARAMARKENRDPDGGDDISEPQAKAIIGWCASKEEDQATLRAIAQPALVVHGSDDTMFPSINAYNMFKAMRNAQLLLYPDAGHGALFQYPERFVTHCRTFLDE